VWQSQLPTRYIVAGETINILVTVPAVRPLPNVRIQDELVFYNDVAIIYHEVIEIQPLPPRAYTVNVNGQKKRFRRGRLRSGLPDETGDLPPMPLAAAHPIASQAKADAQRDAEKDVKKTLGGCRSCELLCVCADRCDGSQLCGRGFPQQSTRMCFDGLCHRGHHFVSGNLFPSRTRSIS